MVADGDELYPGDILAKIPRETTRTKDITEACRAWSELFEARKPHDPAIISKIDAWCASARSPRAAQGLRHRGQRAGRGVALPRGVYVTLQEENACAPGTRSSTARATARHLEVLASARYRCTCQRNPGGLPGLRASHISDKHIGDQSFARCAHGYKNE